MASSHSDPATHPVVLTGQGEASELTAITAGGGRHLYYRYPLTEKSVSNGAGRVLSVGVDARAEGAYAVASPVRTSGLYEWTESREIAKVTVGVCRRSRHHESAANTGSGAPR